MKVVSLLLAVSALLAAMVLGATRADRAYAGYGGHTDCNWGEIDYAIDDNGQGFIEIYVGPHQSAPAPLDKLLTVGPDGGHVSIILSALPDLIMPSNIHYAADSSKAGYDETMKALTDFLGQYAKSGCPPPVGNGSPLFQGGLPAGPKGPA